MSTTRPIAEYSRQELYCLIWSTPAIKLAADFGISNVAIAKRCIRLHVPRPYPGYWAKIAAGQNPRKKPLPPTPNDAFKQAAQKRLPKNLPLPAETEELLPLASELVSAIKKAKLDHYKRAHIQERTLPVVTASKSLAERVGRAFHVLLKQLEPLGICFRKFQGSYAGGYFQRSRDRLYLTIDEAVLRPDGSRISVPWWQSPQADEKPSGLLTFSVKSERYGARETNQWAETARCPLEKTLAQVVAEICKHFLEAQERSEREAIESAKRHAEWLERTREWEQAEAIRLKKEEAREHSAALATAVQARKTALLKAAENWSRSTALLEFIGACETRWKSQSPTLSAEQTAWLTWAKEIAASLSPFSAGYPNPADDGGFDTSSVPFGGPYPAPRNFSHLIATQPARATSAPAT